MQNYIAKTTLIRLFVLFVIANILSCGLNKQNKSIQKNTIQISFNIDTAIFDLKTDTISKIKLQINNNTSDTIVIKWQNNRKIFFYAQSNIYNQPMFFNFFKLLGDSTVIYPYTDKDIINTTLHNILHQSKTDNYWDWKRHDISPVSPAYKSRGHMVPVKYIDFWLSSTYTTPSDTIRIFLGKE